MGRVTAIARSVMSVTGVTARGAKLNRSKICRKARFRGRGGRWGMAPEGTGENGGSGVIKMKPNVILLMINIG